MRIAPKKYPKIFNQVVKLWNRSFKDQALKANPDAKCSIEFCNNLENVVNCCYGLLTPMNVGFVAYYNGDPDSPNKILSESKLTDSNPLYNEDGASYSVEDIKHYDKYSPFVQTLLIAKGADHYLTKILPTKDQKKALNTSAKKKFKEICSKPICDKIPGYCEMCAQFPNPAEAVTSASGYDLSPIVYPIGAIITVIDEMVNIKNEDFLYLVRIDTPSPCNCCYLCPSFILLRHRHRRLLLKSYQLVTISKKTMLFLQLAVHRRLPALRTEPPVGNRNL